jgi:hypothetical protein
MDDARIALVVGASSAIGTPAHVCPVELELQPQRAR